MSITICLVASALGGLAPAPGLGAGDSAPAGESVPLPGMSEVRNLCMQGLGGDAAVGQLQSLRANGQVTIGDAVYPIVVMRRRPDSLRVEVTTSQGLYVRVADGGGCWQQAPWIGNGKAVPLDPAQARILVEEADFLFPLVISTRSNQDVGTVTAARRMPDGNLIYTVRVNMRTSGAGASRELDIDGRSGCLLRSRVRFSPDAPLVESVYGEYARVGQLQLPFRISTFVDGIPVSVTEYKTMMVNPFLPKQSFTMPK